MPPWRFVHAADLHLDSPFVGLRELQADLARELMEASFTSFQRIVDLCLEARAEFLLLAGDLFDQPQGTLKAQLHLRRELERLAAAGIETFLVHGNHDHLGGRGVTLEWPAAVTVFPAQQVELAEVRRRGETLARICGLSHAGPGESANLTPKFSPASRGPFTVGLLHANLDRNSEHDNYAPCTLADLARLSYDYWALGHIHRPGVRRDSQPAVVYAGNPQGRHLKEAGPRGCYLVEVDGHQASPRFQATGPIGWEEVPVDISGLEKVDQVLAVLQKLVEDQRPEAPQQGAVWRLALQGRGPVHRELKPSGVLDDLLQELRRQGRSMNPWVWVEALSAETAPDFDLTALSQGQNLAATLLSHLDEARENPTLPPEIQKILDPLFNHHVARHYLPPAPGWPEILDEVTSELLNRLLKAED
jgi:DNA repair exonuclease SbcCD nuclease subunit